MQPVVLLPPHPRADRPASQTLHTIDMDGQETMDHSAAVAVTEAAYQRRHDQKRARRAEERDAPSLPRDQRRVSKWKQYERDTTDANFRKAAAFECSCSLHSCASITLQLFEQCAQMRFNMEQDKSKDNPVDRRLLKMLVPTRCYDPRDASAPSARASTAMTAKTRAARASRPSSGPRR